MKKLNLQLWSAKDIFEKNVDEGFDFIKKIGVTGVEFYSWFDIKKEEMLKKLTLSDLETVSAHVELARLESNLEYELEYLNYLGCKSIVCPYAAINSCESAKAYADKLNRIGSICNKNGFNLSYHNHANEFTFDRGMYPLDVFYENTEPELVKAQLDVYWIMYAGLDPYKYVEKYKNRMITIHLKQGDENNNNVDAKDGIIDFKKIMDIIPKVVPVYEQEFEKDVSLEQIKISLKNSANFLKKG